MAGHTGKGGRSEWQELEGRERQPAEGQRGQSMEHARPGQPELCPPGSGDVVRTGREKPGRQHADGTPITLGAAPMTEEAE